MKIDEKALDIAVDVYCKVSDEDGDIRNAVHEILTAYEAARWRPICEVPITPNEPVYPIYVEMFNGHHVGIGYAQESYDDENVLEFWSETGEPIEPKPIMFRTIDPPPKP